MAGSILSRTIGTVDQRLVLANSPSARLLAIGTSWTSLRVGFRLCLNDPAGASITGTPKIALGLCSGTTNKYANVTTDNFLGVAPNNATWTFNGGTPNRYGTLDFRTLKRVGTTDTVGGVTITNVKNITGTPATYRTAWVVEITKGSPFSVNGIFPGNAELADISLTTLQNAMETSTLAGCATALGMSAGSAQTQTMDEATDGFLNAVCMFWDRTASQIEISDVLVTKVS